MTLGTAGDFEAIGSRLGFRMVEDTPDRLCLIWQGPRFPAFLCLGIALLLLGVSVPIAQAIDLRGFIGPAGSLWYFPLMNLILFGISLYLLSQKRRIVIDNAKQELSLTRRTLFRTVRLSIGYEKIAAFASPSTTSTAVSPSLAPRPRKAFRFLRSASYSPTNRFCWIGVVIAE